MTSMRRTTILVWTGLMAALGGGVTQALGQWACEEPQWQPGPSSIGTDSQVMASCLHDPDGAGPAKPLLVIGGSFQVAGNISAPGIAALDIEAQEWRAVGEPPWTGQVFTLAIDSRGDLIAGGVFDLPNNPATQALMRWDGQTWTSMDVALTSGSVFGPSISAIHPLPGGEMIIGGMFTHVNGIAANNIARWDGSTWSPLGGGLTEGLLGYTTASALMMLPNGDLVAGGRFQKAGASSALNVARWDGTTWHAMGAGFAGEFDQVLALLVAPNGDVFAGGTFSGGMARWDGSTWARWPVAMSSVLDLAFASNGDLIATGNGTGTTVVRWTGPTWVPVDPSLANPPAFHSVSTITMLPGDEYFVAGKFSAYGLENIARRSGDGWTAPTPRGLNNDIYSVVEDPRGGLFVGGRFTMKDGATIHRVARVDAEGHWHTLENGLTGDALTVVHELAVCQDGSLVAGGLFNQAGGVNATNIARWDGSSWSPMGSGTSNYVLAVMSHSSGDVIAGGVFVHAGGQTVNFIARWDGTQWNAIGGGMNNGVSAIIEMPSGDLVVGGAFSKAGTTNAIRIARWNGTAWSALGTGLNDSVQALVAVSDQALIAGGWFTQAGGVDASRIAKWNGTTWSALSTGINEPFGSPSVSALGRLSNGDIIVGGSFDTAGGMAARNIARWNGVNWSPLDSGIGIGSVAMLQGHVSGIAILSGNEVAACGSFTIAGSSAARNLSVYRCPPEVCLADCDGSGTLAVDDFICFQTLFALGDPSADCDGSGTLAVDDFICFQTLFAVGC